MDSGVETGNDSNDSSVTQHENLVGIFGQPQSNVINMIDMVLPFMNNIPVISKNSATESSSDMIALTEATSQESLPGASEMIQSTPNNSLVSFNAFNSQPMFSLSYIPVNGEPNVINRSISTFELCQLLSKPNNDYRQLPPIDQFYDIKAKYTGKMKTFLPSSTVLRRRRFYKHNLPEKHMRLAATTNNIEMMQQLLNFGISPNNCDEQGRSPLHLASCRGYTKMVKLLLTYGADPNRRDCLGSTPLHLAAITSKISVVTLLLKAGTDVLSLDNHGHNPLQLAQTKLRLLQKSKGGAAEMGRIKDEVHNVIDMLMAYLQKQKDAHDQVEALSAFCSKLSLSNTTDEIQDDVRNLLANINSLSLTN